MTSFRDDPRRQSLLKMIACLLNKDQNDAQVTTFVNSVVSELWTSKEDHDRRKESVELISWVAPPEILLMSVGESNDFTNTCTRIRTCSTSP